MDRKTSVVQPHLTAGTLTIRVRRLEAAAAAASPARPTSLKPHAVRFVVGKAGRTSKFTKLGTAVDERLQLPVHGATASDQQSVTLTIVHKKRGNKRKTLVTTVQPLAEFLEAPLERRLTFTFGATAAPTTVVLYFCVQWEPTPTDDALARVAPVHSPYFLRAQYYYDTGKRVYGYTTSFRLVAPFARFGEHSATRVLAAVSGKSLVDIEAAWVNPSLAALDGCVDAGVSTVLTALYSAQQTALQTKDEALAAATHVALKTGAAVVSVKDFATEKAVCVSSCALDVVKGVAVAVLRHVPVLGAKLTA
ncbi:unnamed protein product [Hyaloperonospora brassicae]|uniref:Senescence domain-containing protein n=1 Tax=Hyaloperonospora brassicae TaxID=162125 RepID=A0AAV0T4P1_HYABA|nr:unnamed protein product [Hyaloperonospora brassicae]